ncbi:MAG: acyl-CoA thioesterase [Oscillospiraceae bacterium]|jgi:acyl-CoA hydrolase|nr:acyl-CoA thioesterase [Oscillospiraceae bacterium]
MENHTSEVHNIPAKHVSDSEIEQIQPVFNAHLNSQNRLFGGQLVAWIDVAAGATARRHSCHNVTTAEIDSLQFKEPVCANDVVVLHSRMTYVGRTSMEVRVDSYVESLNSSRKLVNTAYLVLVALDENGHPTPVPQLICETPEEKAEFAAGQKRRELRRTRREEQF